MEPKYTRRNVRPTHRRPVVDEEDPNEILSGIMHTQTSKAPQAQHADQPTQSGKRTNGSSKRFSFRRLNRTFLHAFGIIVLVVLTLAAAYSIILPRLTPSPFTKELKESIDFSLYFPTKLPESFQLELQSIQKPADDRVFYIISSTDGRAVNITQQRAVEGVNVFEKFASDTEPQKVPTPYGEAIVVTTNDGTKAGILHINKTWIFVGVAQDVLSDEQLAGILTSFKKG